MAGKKEGSSPFDSLLSEAMDHKEKYSTPQQDAQKIRDSENTSSEDVIEENKRKGEIKVLGEGKVREDPKNQSNIDLASAERSSNEINEKPVESENKEAKSEEVKAVESNPSESSNSLIEKEREKPFADDSLKKDNSGETPAEKNENKLIRWFSEINKAQKSTTGEKASKLGEMYNSNFPVPPGFIITSKSYKRFIEETGAKRRIEELLNKINSANEESQENIDEVSKQIKNFILQSTFPGDLREEILQAYEDLHASENPGFSSSSGSHGGENSGSPLDILKTTPEPIFVSVRNSPIETQGNLKEVMDYDNFLNVKGNRDLIKYIKECFASLFNPESIKIIKDKNSSKGEDFLEEFLTCIIVQKMIDSDKSGIAYSKAPGGNSKNVIIKSIWGLGEGITNKENESESKQEIVPDKYVVSPELEIVEEKPSHKEYAITRNSSGDRLVVPLKEKADYSSLSRYEAKRIADFSQNLERHFQEPQEVEFAIEGEDFSILQSRTMGSLKIPEETEKTEEVSESKGDGESNEVNKESPKSEGTEISEEISQSNEDQQKYQEAQETHEEKEKYDVKTPGKETSQEKPKREKGEEKYICPINKNTKTKVNIALEHPEELERALKTNCESLGLIKIEGIIKKSGRHPQSFSEKGDEENYEELIFNELSKIANSFENFWVRTSDIKTNQYENLEGSSQIKKENNPLLGVHGIRYSLNRPELLKSELRALKRISDIGREVGVLIPHITTLEELKTLKSYMKEIDFHDGNIGVLIENPAALQLIKEFVEEGIDFVSFNMSSLTQHILSVDKSSEELFNEKYNERHPAIIRQMEFVLRVCKRNNIPVSICEQSESIEGKKQLISELTEKGITSVTVPYEEAKEISDYIAKEEGQEINENPKENKETNVPEESKETDETEKGETNKSENNEVFDENKELEESEQNEEEKPTDKTDMIEEQSEGAEQTEKDKEPDEEIHKRISENHEDISEKTKESEADDQERLKNEDTEKVENENQKEESSEQEKKNHTENNLDIF